MAAPVLADQGGIGIGDVIQVGGDTVLPFCLMLWRNILSEMFDVGTYKVQKRREIFVLFAGLDQGGFHFLPGWN